MSFRVVFLCTGNRARSALAEALLGSMVRDLPVEVTSAGVLELKSGRALPEAIEAAKPLGLNLKKHRSTPLSEVDVACADVVIGFERQHVAAAIQRGRADPDRTFLITGMIQLLEQLPRLTEPGADPVARARERIAAIATLRRSRELDPPEIEDPIGQSIDDFDNLAGELQTQCASLTQGLFGVQIIHLDPPDASKSSKRTALLKKLRRN